MIFLLSLGSAPRTLAAEGQESGRVAPTVVLLHGLGRSARNMLILKWRLQGRGYHVCNVDYDSRVDALETAADAVHASLEECVTTDGPVHFVTHSLGGLVLRSLLERHPPSRAGRAVMLAPPNAGSEIADHFRGSVWTRSILGPLADQLGTGADDLPRRLPIPSIPFGVIAGNQWINPAGPLWLPGPHDGTVSVASTRLPGMLDHIVLPYTHTFIMNPARVADQIEAFLEQGRFLHPARTSGPPRDVVEQFEPRPG
jgi:pimeloyl-ACP methyl ester carboxylesterase